MAQSVSNPDCLQTVLPIFLYSSFDQTFSYSPLKQMTTKSPFTNERFPSAVEMGSLGSGLPPSHQMDVPMQKSDRRMGGMRTNRDGKIVNYSFHDLRIWRALFAVSRSVMSQGDTWKHLGYLTIISGVAMAASAPIDIAGSIPLKLLEGELLSRTKTLLAFTLVGFVSFMVRGRGSAPSSQKVSSSDLGR